MNRRPRQRRVRVLAALALSGLLLGCPKPLPRYPNAAEARTGLLAARDAARAARDAQDLDAASRAAELATDALAQSEAFTGAAAVDSATLLELRRAEREARELAQETDERLRLASQLAGLKASAWRGARGAAVGATFQGLALAARQADQRGLDALPEQVRRTALQAAALAESACGRPPAPEGTPDWAAIAGDMERLAAAPPAELGITLTVGFALCGRTGLALVESEALDPTRRSDPSERLALHLLRGLVRDLNGYRRLAVLEVEDGLRAVQGTDALGAGGVELSASEVLGGVHLLLAIVHLQEEQYADADRELALALAAWPENPAAEFLTGERLLASGQREQAAQSLERCAQGKGEDAEWLAERLAARARAIRDGQDEAEGGLIGDPVWLTRLALHALWSAGARSREAAQARAQVAQARAFCGDLLAHVPGLGGDAEAAPVDSGR